MPFGIPFVVSILILGILSVLLIVLVLLVLLTLVILLVLVILIVLLIVLLIVVLHGFLHFSVGKSIRKQSSPTEYDCHSAACKRRSTIIILTEYNLYTFTSPTYTWFPHTNTLHFVSLRLRQQK